MKLHIGDSVLVTSGREKGRRGPVERVLVKEERVVVRGINLYKRHKKPLGGQKGGVVEFARSLPMGNVALVCPVCNKPTRVAYRVDKTGSKSRICVKCKEVIGIKK